MVNRKPHRGRSSEIRFLRSYSKYRISEERPLSRFAPCSGQSLSELVVVLGVLTVIGMYLAGVLGGTNGGAIPALLKNVSDKIANDR